MVLDSTRNPESVTYHDPCNLARSSGITEEPRFLLNKACSDSREMYPNRADSFCCSGQNAVEAQLPLERVAGMFRPGAGEAVTAGPFLAATAAGASLEGSLRD
jgi:Fe-S oxidoreductase